MSLRSEIEQLRAWRGQAEHRAGSDPYLRQEGEMNAFEMVLEMLPVTTDLEYELRREWWVHHGHPFPALYGDDGEMSCGRCALDFKRMPLDELAAAVRRVRLESAEAAVGRPSPYSFAQWIVSLDEPGSTDRRSVTMTTIVEEARKALEEAKTQVTVTVLPDPPHVAEAIREIRRRG